MPSQSSTTDRGKWLTSPVAVLSIVALLHLGSLFNGFLADDYAYLYTVSKLTWSSLPGLFTTGTLTADASGVWWTPDGVLPFYRPLAIASFAIDYRIWGMNPFGYHLVSLLLHLLCTYLTWRLARRLFTAPSLALVAAMLFAIHPVHSEAVLWISGRFDLLVCACMLGSVLAYLNWRGHQGGSRWWALLCMVCFVCGLGCKETALILPGVLLAAEWLRWRTHHTRAEQERCVAHGFSRGGRRCAENPFSAPTRGPRKDSRSSSSSPPPLKRWATHPWRGRSLALGAVSLAAVSVAYLIARFRMFGGLGFLPPPYGVDLSSLSGIVELLMHLAQYLLDFVLFIQIDMVYMDEFWASHPWLLLLIAALAIAIAAAAWRVAGKTRAFRVGLIWTILFTLPTLPAMPGERNVYLASVGVALMGAGVLSALIQRMKTRVTVGWWLPPAAVAVASVCVALLAFEQVIVWRAAGASDQVYDDLLAALPDPPPGARIYVVNQSPLNSIGFTQAVRLMYDRDDILACALTVAPQLEGISSDLVDRTGPASVRIVRQNGRFFQGFFERLLLLGNPAADLPESAKRMELRLLTRLESLDAVIELELGLPRNLDDEGIYLFTWDNRHVITTADLIWRAPWPNLVKCRFAQPPDALASN